MTILRIKTCGKQIRSPKNAKIGTNYARLVSLSMFDAVLSHHYQRITEHYVHF